MVRNEDNTLAGALDYMPYGEALATANTGVDHRFTGKYRDTTAALDYFPYRHYNPALARWTTADPLGMVVGYRYRPPLFAHEP